MPGCCSRKMLVVDTRPAGGSRVRKYRCSRCGKFAYTAEREISYTEFCTLMGNFYADDAIRRTCSNG